MNTTKNRAAVALGRLGGSKNTEAQLAARRANIPRTGRPKGSKNKAKKLISHPAECNINPNNIGQNACHTDRNSTQ